MRVAVFVDFWNFQLSFNTALAKKQGLQGTGKKIIQAGFPPRGVDLATECWGSFSVMDIADRLQRMP